MPCKSIKYKYKYRTAHKGAHRTADERQSRLSQGAARRPARPDH